MTDVPSTNENVSKYVPWDTGKIVGAKPPTGRSTSGQSGRSFRLKAGPVIWR